MAEQPRVLTVSQFEKQKGPLKGPVLIYLDAQQWKNLNRGLQKGRGKPPTDRLTIALVEIPGLPGGLLAPKCPDDQPNGPIGGEDGELRCGKAPAIPGGPSPRPPEVQDFCALVLRSSGSILCRGRCAKAGKKCRPIVWFARARPGQSRFGIVACACG